VREMGAENQEESKRQAGNTKEDIMADKHEIERTDLHSYLAGLARRLRFLGHSVTALAEQDWTAGSELSEMGGMLALEANRLGRVAEALERSTAMREVVDRHDRGAARARRVAVAVPSVAPEREETPALGVAAEPSRLLSRLRAAEFLVTVELDPPRGHNIEKLVQGAKLLAERGVDVVDINDGSLGRVRMASSRSSCVYSGWPATATTTSPGLSPAFSEGDPGPIDVIIGNR